LCHYIRLYKGRDFHNTSHQQTVHKHQYLPSTTNSIPNTKTPVHLRQCSQKQYKHHHHHHNNNINEQNNNDEISKLLNTLLGDFKSMFNQLIQQNSMVLNMLTILIGKNGYFFRITLWDANGLINREEELKIVLQDQLIDIMLISETHFTDKSHLQILGHKVYHTSHPDITAHAGTAIIIKSTIEHQLLNKYEKDYLQATSIRVKTLAYEITVSAVSCAPRRHNVKKEDFKDFFSNI
jgi:hypothetical protein